MRYEPASSSPWATGCQPGTLALADAVRAVYPELACMTAVYGCFNRRRIEGSRAWSLHAEGRALDVGVQPPEAGLGWQLACELVGNRVLYGVMRLIWDGHIWSVERINEWEQVGPGTSPHLDHLHIEQYRGAAGRSRGVTAAYRVALQRARTAASEAS